MAKPSSRLRRVAADNPLQGGLTGIALVALGTIAFAAAGAVICGVLLLLVG